MSFFGFDTALPRDRAGPSGGRGIFEQHDPFGSLRRDDVEDDEMLDFDATYAGLGQELDESGDTFNEDTFGGDEPVTRQTVGKDFDFAGQTAQMRDELLEEQALHHARQPQTQPQLQPQLRPSSSKPKRTGYEAYKEPEYIPKLEADASIWGTAIGKKSVEPPARTDSSTGRKMMSVEEVEAMMRSQAKPTPPPAQDTARQSQGLRDMLGMHSPPPAPQPQAQEQARPVQILQRPQQPPEPPHRQHFRDQSLRAPQVLQRQPSPQNARPSSQDFHGPPPYPTPAQHPLEIPVGPPAVQPPHGRVVQQPMHARGPSYNGPPVTQARQVISMTSGEREAYLAEEAKRAKRNHKIFLLSKNNGLMTPQDKNFITRIQLQQLLTATGGIDNEPGSENQLGEDFYYQVYAQIRGPPRSGPGQPLNQFAQTYLFQTGSRYGYGRSRHHPRGGDNHVQRMEQQIARAVEAAKARPKNKSLVVQGSLGKIAFSNSKTPRPLLNIKQADSESRSRPATRQAVVADRKAALRNIERMYTALMKLEDHERRLPPPPNEDSAPDVIEGHMRWRSEMQKLNEQLWESLKVMEPMQPSPSSPHPFIQILAHAKGKKAIPRVFRHLDEQQRLTMLTLIAINLDMLDVIRDAQPDPSAPPAARVKEEVELFAQAVMPPLFSYVNEAPLPIVIGLLGLVLDRVHVPALLRTKIGLSMLTMLVSRAELVAQATAAATAAGGARQQQGGPADEDDEDRAQWQELYARLFDTIEPALPHLFPHSIHAGAADAEDVHVWQFLAAMGVGASPDQQQRLVLGVKERVMETVGVSKTLPDDMRARRLAEVNLFMRAIGLDVELLG